MYKISKILKYTGLLLWFGVPLVLIFLELLVPGMEGAHWFGMLTFIPGLVLYILGILLDNSEPLKSWKKILLIILLLFMLPVIFNLIRSLFTFV